MSGVSHLRQNPPPRNAHPVSARIRVYILQTAAHPLQPFLKVDERVRLIIGDQALIIITAGKCGIPVHDHRQLVQQPVYLRITVPHPLEALVPLITVKYVLVIDTKLCSPSDQNGIEFPPLRVFDPVEQCSPLQDLDAHVHADPAQVVEDRLKQWLRSNAEPADLYQLVGMPRFHADRGDLLGGIRSAADLTSGSSANACSIRGRRVRQSSLAPPSRCLVPCHAFAGQLTQKGKAAIPECPLTPASPLAAPERSEVGRIVSRFGGFAKVDRGFYPPGPVFSVSQNLTPRLALML
jgi:hypothetical protein